MNAHPRRRPSGGTKRSISGDQRNLNVHGAWASVNSPTTRMSTPDLRIQSGIATQISPRGIPEANDISVTDAVRHEVKACPRLWKVPGFFCGIAGLLKRTPLGRRLRRGAYSESGGGKQ
jgi:hypothetical protein